MHLKLIYNPSAGRGRARRLVSEIEEYLRAHGARVDSQPSASASDLTRIAAESSRADYDRVVVVGGDGTLNLAVREFDLAKGTIALIPSGSGNDFARGVGLPRDVRGACENALNGRVREVDVAVANDLRYLTIAGLGFDSEVGEYANKVRFLRGSLVYFYSILRVLPKFTPRPVRIRTENDSRDQHIMFAAIANTRYYGGGIPISPDAVPDDGMLDACIVRETTRMQLLMTLPKAYSGAHVRTPYAEIRRCREFHFESETPMTVVADGDPLTKTPVSFGILPQRLKFVVPRS